MSETIIPNNNPDLVLRQYIVREDVLKVVHEVDIAGWQLTETGQENSFNAFTPIPIQSAVPFKLTDTTVVIFNRKTYSWHNKNASGEGGEELKSYLLIMGTKINNEDLCEFDEVIPKELSPSPLKFSVEGAINRVAKDFYLKYKPLIRRKRENEIPPNNLLSTLMDEYGDIFTYGFLSQMKTNILMNSGGYLYWEPVNPEKSKRRKRLKKGTVSSDEDDDRID